MKKSEDKLNLIELMDFEQYESMYKVIDFLNKNLKNKGIIFGLTRKNSRDIISIYDGGESFIKINE